MTKPKLTPYAGNPEYSDNQRRLGPHLYSSDLDMKLRKYVNGRSETVAIFECKHGMSNIIDLDDSNIVADRIMCDEEFKNPVPHFIVIYYLPPSFEIPMYLVLGNNQVAQQNIKNYNNGQLKFWYSEEQYSKFQYFLINKPWSPISLSSLEVRYDKPKFIRSKH